METTIITFGLGVVLTLTVLAIVSLLKSNKQISELDSLVNHIEYEVQTRIDSVDMRMDEAYHDLDKRLDSRVDRAISQFEKEIEELDKRLDDISLNLNNLKKESVPN